jgi:hypothetical protein
MVTGTLAGVYVGPAADVQRQSEAVRFRRSLTLRVMTLFLPGPAQLVKGNKQVGRIVIHWLLPIRTRAWSNRHRRRAMNPYESSSPGRVPIARFVAAMRDNGRHGSKPEDRRRDVSRYDARQCR